MVAHSEGGGGGDGGLTISAALQGQNPRVLALAVGGNGGVAGNGGDVRLNNYGAVQTGSPTANPATQTGSPTDDPTKWNDATGIVASSVGGGGGSGSLTGAVTGTLVGNTSTPLQASVALGGSGGAGGVGGAVNLTNHPLAPVTTYQNQSPALLGYSTGGGGGNAGYELAASGTFGAPGTGESMDVNVAVGRDAGNGSFGGNVTITNQSELTTHGTESDAIHAYSTGGGGGNAGGLLALTATTAKSSVAMNVAVGGKGGKANEGGDVVVNNYDALMTAGQSSDGIRAASTGGSGGNGAGTLSGLLSYGAGYAANVAVGGDGGTGDPGGDVTVFSAAPIETFGDHADGISAESTGGGGGSAEMTSAAGFRTRVSANVGVGGTGGVGDDGGAVKVDNSRQLYHHRRCATRIRRHISAKHRRRRRKFAGGHRRPRL